MRTSSIVPKFTDRIPKQLEDGVLYISEKFSTSAHSCCCGCGGKVVLPLKPGKWSIKTNGERVSLYPSVGNWSLACQSHYWIENGGVRWSDKFSKAQIAANRVHDKKVSQAAHQQRRSQERGFLQRLLDKIKSFFTNS